MDHPFPNSGFQVLQPQIAALSSIQWILRDRTFWSTSECSPGDSKKLFHLTRLPNGGRTPVEHVLGTGRPRQLDGAFCFPFAHLRTYKLVGKRSCELSCSTRTWLVHGALPTATHSIGGKENSLPKITRLVRNPTANPMVWLINERELPYLSSLNDNLEAKNLKASRTSAKWFQSAAFTVTVLTALNTEVRRSIKFV